MRFKKSDRRALLLLLAAVSCIGVGVFLDRLLLRRLPSVAVLDSVAVRGKAADRVSPSVRPLDSAYYAQRQQAYALHRPAGEPVRVAETFPFDPNTADSAALLRLGLSGWQVRAVLKYRRRGGRYHRVEDFQRVPGMTPEVWERLAPVMRIGEAYRYYHDRPDTPRRAAMADSQPYPRQEKFAEVVQLNLNQADTAALKMIPGIGPVRARRIVRYREQLGGFVSTAQLAEVEDLPEGIARWFRVETGVFRPLCINQLSVAALSRHPYLTYAQARAIGDYRRTYGDIKDLGELRLLDEFTEEDFKRLAPYVAY